MRSESVDQRALRLAVTRSDVAAFEDAARFASECAMGRDFGTDAARDYGPDDLFGRWLVGTHTRCGPHSSRGRCGGATGRRAASPIGGTDVFQPRHAQPAMGRYDSAPHEREGRAVVGVSSVRRDAGPEGSGVNQVSMMRGVGGEGGSGVWWTFVDDAILNEDRPIHWETPYLDQYDRLPRADVITDFNVPPRDDEDDPDSGRFLGVRDFCTAGNITVPLFTDVADETQQCFSDLWGSGSALTTWPEASCSTPCVNERVGSACVAPAPTSNTTVAVVPVTDNFLRSAGLIIDDADPCNDWIGVSPANAITQEEFDYVNAALALLLENLDLVEWACCLAGEWARWGTTGDELADCVLQYLSGEMSLFLIDEYRDPTCYSGQFFGDGGTTSSFPGGVGPDGNPGVVIPIRDSTWQSNVAEYSDPNSSEENRLCVVAILASVILHELIHLCDSSTNPDCTLSPIDLPQLCCGEEQRMAPSIFEWAIGQRYSCIQNTTAPCDFANPCYFANSQRNRATLTC